MNCNGNIEGNYSNTNKTFQETEKPIYAINGKSETEAKDNEQKQRQSENDAIRNSLVGFA